MKDFFPSVESLTIKVLYFCRNLFQIKWDFNSTGYDLISFLRNIFQFSLRPRHVFSLRARLNINICSSGA